MNRLREFCVLNGFRFHIEGGSQVGGERWNVLIQLRRRDAERELEIERLRKENLQAKRATDAAVRIGQELADAARLPASTLPDGMSQEEYDLLATKGAGTIVSQELKASLPDSHPSSAASQKARAESRRNERGAA